MKKTFKLLSSHIKETLISEMEELSENGWQLESFDVAHDGSAITFYALFSKGGLSREISAEIEQELEEIPGVAPDNNHSTMEN